MAVAFGSGVTVITSFWTSFKATVQSKSLRVKYVDDGVITNVFAFDGPTLAYSAIMYDGGNVPDGLQATYSVAQNNTDLSDFTTNWQPTANARINRSDKFGNPIVNEFTNAVVMSPPPGVTGGVVNGYVGTSATSGVPVRA